MAGSVNKTLIAVGGAVAAVAVVGYFVYDRSGSPCESIFEQASTRLNASLNVLHSGGEVAIGKTQIQDLTERSQLVALNLKTCCIVLDGGKLNSGEFLNCKADAARYQAKVTRIGGIVSAALAANAAGQTQVLAAKTKEASQEVEAAKQTANAFIKQVAQFSGKALTLPASDDTPPSAAATVGATPTAAAAAVIGGAEAEPNNTQFEANRIGAGAAITGELVDKTDVDWFRLQPGSKHRDWISIKLENRSQKLRPLLVIYDAEKKNIGEKTGANSGANAEISLIVTPGADYFIEVKSYYLQTAGAYALTPALQNSFDSFEPNDDALTAKPIDVGSVIDSNIMDIRDVDWYRVKAFAGAAMTVRLDNRSSILRPWVAVYDRNKKELVTKEASNKGQSLDIALKVKPGQDYFVAVGSRWNVTGDYRLGVTVGN